MKLPGDTVKPKKEPNIKCTFIIASIILYIYVLFIFILILYIYICHATVVYILCILFPLNPTFCQEKLPEG